MCTFVLDICLELCVSYNFENFNHHFHGLFFYLSGGTRLYDKMSGFEYDSLEKKMGAFLSMTTHGSIECVQQNVPINQSHHQQML